MGLLSNIFSVKKNNDYKLTKSNSRSLKKDNYNKSVKQVDDVQFENVDLSDNGYNYFEGLVQNFDTEAMKKMYERKELR